jgi:hypothetical protein
LRRKTSCRERESVFAAEREREVCERESVFAGEREADREREREKGV